MIVVVDTNILFSACYSPSGRIFDILFNIPASTKLISSHYAIEELTLHRNKLALKAAYTDEEMDTLIGIVLKQVNFYSEVFIEGTYWQAADQLTKGVDSKDISFVALALQTEATLWTGDKKLTNHLRAMGFDRVANTAELRSYLGSNSHPLSQKAPRNFGLGTCAEPCTEIAMLKVIYFNSLSSFIASLALGLTAKVFLKASLASAERFNFVSK